MSEEESRHLVQGIVRQEQREDDADWLARAEMAKPGLGNKLHDLAVPSERVRSAASSANVYYADGLSDSESIRDYDAGGGRTKWMARQPYFYRRDRNMD